LSFVLCSLAAVAHSVKRHGLSLAFSALVVVIGIATLFEYATQINLVIDEIFMEHYITVLSSHPARMAPLTSLQS